MTRKVILPADPSFDDRVVASVLEGIARDLDMGELTRDVVATHLSMGLDGYHPLRTQMLEWLLRGTDDFTLTRST